VIVSNYLISENSQPEIELHGWYVEEADGTLGFSDLHFLFEGHLKDIYSSLKVEV
jgi:hypothetical protein